MRVSGDFLPCNRLHLTMRRDSCISLGRAGSSGLRYGCYVSKFNRMQTDPHTSMPPELVRSELDKLLAHTSFSASERQKSFLRFVVEKRLANRPEEVKEVLIATEVYGRASSYDPQVDAIVRVDAGRIRGKLGKYYEGDGASSPIRISIPRGSYYPEIVLIKEDVPQVVEPVPEVRPRTFPWRLAAGAAVLLALGFLYWYKRPAATAVDEQAMRTFLRAEAKLHEDPYTSNSNGRVPGHIEEAIGLFEQLTQTAPLFARGWSGLANACSTAASFDSVRAANLRQRAVSAAERAISLDGRLSEPHYVLATIRFYDLWEFSKAAQSYRRALELNPNDVASREEYSDVLRLQGDHDGAVAEIGQALELEPRSPRLLLQKALLEYDERRYMDALATTQKALTIRSDYRRGHWLIGLCHERLGRWEEAERAYRNVLAVAPGDLRALPALGFLLGHTGRKTEATRVLAELRAKEKGAAESEFLQALVLAGLQDEAAALDALERARERREPSSLYLRFEQRFESLFKNPRFMRLASLPGR